MSFLSELMKQKQILKETETVVTCADGQRFVEKRDSDSYDRTACASNSYGFVVDTKPDDVPAQVIDHLFIGSQDCTSTNVLEKYEIKHILSLGISVEAKDVDCKFVQCLDLPETDIRPVLLESLPFIHKAVKTRENILVHCNAGVSRTAMVAIGYLMQYANMEFVEAYNLVKSKRPAVQPNTGFRKQLSSMKPGKVMLT
ncbi:unnamed protein product [Plutella xylostella]|uniref:(diamondback moth) hypothetical protein n=1 Tax=Plutella xylostella TaxID=51655 RepID=A0A8S4DGD2_PLUXY|nr:unnamed protein product [Plutella xylostella]